MMCTLNHWTPALVAAPREFGGTVLLRPGSVLESPAAVHCTRFSIQRVLLRVGGDSYCLRSESLCCCGAIERADACALCRSAEP